MSKTPVPAAITTPSAPVAVLTVNADTVYYLAFLDLSDGPLVVETPPDALGVIDLRAILDDAVAVGNAASRTLGMGAHPTEGSRYYDGDSAWWISLWVGGFEFTNPPPEITKDGIKPCPNKGARRLHSRTSFFSTATGITPAIHPPRRPRPRAASPPGVTPSAVAGDIVRKTGTSYVVRSSVRHWPRSVCGIRPTDSVWTSCGRSSCRSPDQRRDRGI
ncbi:MULTISPECIES: DUF1254 domain-containing protein [Kribbella]|uniref:DUF1254 domain-containing protein n=1 Tax=Kribbella TaxID=182639 RepID=UPI0018EE6017|nr:MULTISPECIES: DUF1254 domain-containing protein [Kribbella]